MRIAAREGKAASVEAETTEQKLPHEMFGAHGRIEKPFGFGGIAQEIVRISPIPVLVMPLPVTTAMFHVPEETGMALP
jgi:nucleotide-binding universal stress UspA family protein